MTRVVVCDGSPAFVAALRRLLEHDGTIRVTGARATTDAAIAATATLDADLAIVAGDLPHDGGLPVVEHLMATRPLPIVALAEREDARACIAAGALETVSRAALPLADPAAPAAEALRRRVVRLARVRVIPHPRARLRARAPVAVRPRAVEAIGVVASTGGPQALRTVLGGIAQGFPVPILVVQHLAAGFTRSFGDWLRTSITLPVGVVDAPTPLTPGVWLAPERAHLVLDGGSMRVDRREREALHTPSGDVLLTSVAESCGDRAVAVVLSGMGRDGAAGVRCVRDAGGFAIAQDESTSAIFGMPRVAAAGGVDLVLPLDAIASALTRLAAPA